MNEAPDQLWYKDAVIYQLHIKAFYDANNDGIGDFAGLIQKLDYVQALGVTAVWILPFYPSPLRDDGYDIADYNDVNPMYGKLDDFKTFVAEAHARGLRVITELVINHTSDQHPWFQRARLAPPSSPERDFYVWNDTDDRFSETRIIFTDTEKSNWAWDPVAKQYYWHRFFSHQPDLNFDNPAVMDEVLKAMYFWLDMGVDGLRLDAIPYLVERDGTNNENLPETHAVIKQIRAALDAKYPDRLLLAEANQWPEDVREYFGDGDECHMAFHFPVMPRIYMAVAQEDRHPITDIMYQTPAIPENCQWAMFLRNHDELTLEMVTDRERDYLWNFYAADKRARINVGIRRRLAPLMENDRRRIELLNGILLSMPGTPILYYGDEIGMGDNIYLGDRDGVRTPMQWSPDRNGGFSKVDPARLYLPAVQDAVYGFAGVNVEAQQSHKNSQLNWTKNLLAARKTAGFGRGSLEFLRPTNRKVLAYLRQHGDETILCVANLSQAPQPAEIDLAQFTGAVPVEMLSKTEFPAIGTLPYFLTLSPYGFYWFRLNKSSQGKDDAQLALPEWRTLVVPNGWDSLLFGQILHTLETEILPEFLLRQRWYKLKDGGVPVVKLVKNLPFGEYQVLTVAATSADHDIQHYILLCGLAWESMQHDPSTLHQKQLLARVRQGARVGVLYEIFQDADALHQLFLHIMRHDNPALRFTKPLPAIDLDTIKLVPMMVEQSNSSALVGNDYIFKLIRQPEPGVNIEEEINGFLTNTAKFDRTPPLYSALHVTTTDATIMTVGLLQGAVRNQGDGWAVTQNYLQSMLDDDAKSDFNYYKTLAAKLGQRTAEMHQALLTATDNAAFKPELVTPDLRADLLKQVGATAVAAQQALQSVVTKIIDVQPMAKQLLENWPHVTTAISKLLPEIIKMPLSRVHGDYHLGQVLVIENDFTILDFEGEPARTIEERRRKQLAFKDVAGMLRSFDYARHAAAMTQSAFDQTNLESWYQAAATAFLNSYSATTAPHDSATDQQRLVQFFMLEKALYEIIYESNNRPNWLFIPIQGLSALLAGVQQ